MKHYPHHIGDFDKATRHLTRIERSIYRDLIELYYDTEQMIPLDLAAVCRRILARSNEESTAVEQTLNEFFTKTATGWYHDRCEAVLDEYRSNTSQRAMAGKASAEAKRLKKMQIINARSTTVEPPLVIRSAAVEQTSPPVLTEFNGEATNHKPITNNHINTAAAEKPAAVEIIPPLILDPVINPDPVKPPPGPLTPKEIIFTNGLRLLTKARVPEGSARALLGKWCKTYPEPLIVQVISAAEIESPIDPKSWISKALAQRMASTTRSGLPHSDFGAIDYSKGVSHDGAF